MYSWATAKRTYEGFPLYLRRPTDVDTPEHRSAFPALAVITHQFRKRLSDGRPDFDYNDSLADFDCAIVTLFDATREGVPVLVETFGGKRHYYFYVSLEADLPLAVDRVRASFPDEPLTWTTRQDTNWSFLDRYAEEFF